MKYLLPCSCSRTIPVDIGQAGQRVQCECGQTLEVPTMRGIKALAPAAKDPHAPVRGAPAAWTPLQGWLFSIGILTAFLAGSIGGFCGYVASRIHVHEPTQQQIAELDQAIDGLPVDELYNVYLTERERGIVTAVPAYVHAKRVKAYYWRLTTIAACVAGVGFLLAGTSFFVGKK